MNQKDLAAAFIATLIQDIACNDLYNVHYKLQDIERLTRILNRLTRGFITAREALQLAITENN